jgi:hypothetical protein
MASSGVHSISTLYEQLWDDVEAASLLRNQLARGFQGSRDFLQLYWTALRGGGWIDPRRVRDARSAWMRSKTGERDHDSPFAEAVVEPHWLEALAEVLVSRRALTGREIASLQKLHAERAADERMVAGVFSAKALFAGLAGVAAIVVSQVPEGTFRLFGWTQHSYEIFRTVVFLGFVVLLLYLILISTPLRIGMSKWRQITQRLGIVLMYCEIAAGSEDNPARVDANEQQRV